MSAAMEPAQLDLAARAAAETAAEAARPAAEAEVAPLTVVEPDAAPPAPPAGLFVKLAEVFAELEEVAADKRHENQGWAYASADAVLRTVREPLRRRRVLVLPATRGDVLERPFKTSGGKDRLVSTVRLVFTLVDADTGETWPCEWVGSGADDAEKGTGKAITVGLRTFLRDLFLLPEGGDDAPGGSRAPRGTNERGEKYASQQQLAELDQLASGTLSALEYLNALLAAAGAEAVDVSEDAALKAMGEARMRLTTKQAEELKAKLRRDTEPAGGAS